ncbi:MAG: RNase adapter RapZ [Alphaproteobacteria bacterium]
MKLLLLTGMTGAGRSLSLKMLEDSGYEVLETIPHAFLEAIVNSAGQKRSLAVGVHAGSKDFTPESFMKTVESLRNCDGLEFKLIYMDSDDDIIISRLEQIGEKHPIVADRSIRDGIKFERQLMAKVKEAADVVIDTSEYEDIDLRQFIATHFSDVKRKLSVVVTSFAFKHGIPRDADFMFDARFLQNPHYIPRLKAMTGLDDEVAKYIEQDPEFDAFYSHMLQMLVTVLPRQAPKKHNVTIAVGCTGGRHRSVYVVEKLGEMLEEKGYPVTVRHRDLL